MHVMLNDPLLTTCGAIAPTPAVLNENVPAIVTLVLVTVNVVNVTTSSLSVRRCVYTVELPAIVSSTVERVNGPTESARVDKRIRRDGSEVTRGFSVPAKSRAGTLGRRRNAPRQAADHGTPSIRAVIV